MSKRIVISDSLHCWLTGNARVMCVSIGEYLERVIKYKGSGEIRPARYGFGRMEVGEIKRFSWPKEPDGSVDQRKLENIKAAMRRIERTHRKQFYFYPESDGFIIRRAR